MQDEPCKICKATGAVLFHLTETHEGYLARTKDDGVFRHCLKCRPDCPNLREITSVNGHWHHLEWERREDGRCPCGCVAPTPDMSGDGIICMSNPNRRRRIQEEERRRNETPAQKKARREHENAIRKRQTKQAKTAERAERIRKIYGVE